MQVTEMMSKLQDRIDLLKGLQNSDYLKMLALTTDVIVERMKTGGKILLAGNGGSAADAQHFAGEIVGRFMRERPGASAISLCCDPSVMTCIANDYGYDMVFARQVEGIGLTGDILIAISTSGNSENLIQAVKIARKKGIISVGLLGKGGGRMKELCDYALIVPSDQTPQIQEIHTLTVHLFCEGIESELFQNNIES